MRLRRKLAIGCLVFGLAAAPAFGQGSFCGVWADAFHVGFKSSAQIDDLVARAVTGRYNAIVAEVLAYQDRTGSGHGAYWNSSIVPKAADISGGIDPLAVLCQKAHAQGIEVHAWLVTYRVCTTWPPSGNSIVAAHPEWIMVPQAEMGKALSTASRISGAYTFDPGSPDVQEYLSAIVRELVTNYPIDGINWDYIRYTQTDAGYPSNTSYANSGLERYRRISGAAAIPSSTGDNNWNDFRRRTIDEHVRRSFAEMASISTNPRQPLRHTADLICFGNAPSDFTNSDPYRLHQNWRYWMQQGYLDAGMPMNYKRDHCATQAVWYRNWVDSAIEWSYGRHMICGQANYLNTPANSVAQMSYALAAGADGAINYSYASTVASGDVGTNCSSGGETSDWSFYNYVAANLYTQPTPPPSMPWRHPATATEGTLWGRVTNAADQPVDDATVQVNGQSIKTDGNGYYVATRIPATAAGTSYALTAAKSGLTAAGQPAVAVLAGGIERQDLRIGLPAAQLVLDPSQIHRNVMQGDAPPTDSFMISNTGQATLFYTISDDADWLSVSPAQGMNNGLAESVQISYDLDGVGLGQHTATVSVIGSGALNSPQSVTVTLVVLQGIPGDFDGDSDVDQEDFGRFQACLTGIAGGVPAGCERANLDFDNDVDKNDYQKFFHCLTGPNLPGEADCAD